MLSFCMAAVIDYISSMLDFLTDTSFAESMKPYLPFLLGLSRREVRIRILSWFVVLGMLLNMLPNLKC